MIAKTFLFLQELNSFLQKNKVDFFKVKIENDINNFARLETLFLCWQNLGQNFTNNFYFRILVEREKVNKCGDIAPAEYFADEEKEESVFYQDFNFVYFDCNNTQHVQKIAENLDKILEAAEKKVKENIDKEISNIKNIINS